MMGLQTLSLPVQRATKPAFHSREARRSSVVARAEYGAGNPVPGAKLERWLKRPVDIAAFGARAAFGALVSLPERLQTLPADVEKVSELLQDPRPLEEKQQVVLQEVEDTLVEFLERGASIETGLLANVKTLLPPELSAQLDELIPEPPSSLGRAPIYDVEPEFQPPVVYTAEAVIDNQIVSEMVEIRNSVTTLKGVLEDVRANVDPTRSAMLRLTLRDARDQLARRIREVAPSGSAGAADPSLAAATREATVLLGEVDAQFFD